MSVINVLLDTKYESEIKQTLENLSSIFCAMIKTYEYQNGSMFMTYEVPNMYVTALQSCINSVLTAHTSRNLVTSYYVYKI